MPRKTKCRETKVFFWNINAGYAHLMLISFKNVPTWTWNDADYAGLLGNSEHLKR